MIRVAPTKLQLKAEDLAEYDRHKASWHRERESRDSGRGREGQSSDASIKQDDLFTQRNATRARLGITSSDVKNN